MSIIEISQLKYRWPGAEKLTLDIDAFAMEQGERVFLKGPSGSGKSTLLGLVAGVNQPQEGEVSLLGQSLAKLSGSQRDQFRADHLGYIFQQFNLLPYLSLVENVCLPCHFSKRRKQRAMEHGGSLQDEARRLLRELQLPEELIERPVVELSIGQQQRVAVSRALIGQPELVIADEPTSALDNDTRHAFIELLFKECERHGSSLLFVSHDQTLTEHFDREVQLDEINAASQVRQGRLD